MARSDPEKRPLTEAAIRLGAELNRRTRRLAECSVGHFRFTVERGAEAVWLRARREGQLMSRHRPGVDMAAIRAVTDVRSIDPKLKTLIGRHVHANRLIRRQLEVQTEAQKRRRSPPTLGVPHPCRRIRRVSRLHIGVR